MGAWGSLFSKTEQIDPQTCWECGIEALLVLVKFFSNFFSGFQTFPLHSKGRRDWQFSHLNTEKRSVKFRSDQQEVFAEVNCFHRKVRKINSFLVLCLKPLEMGRWDRGERWLIPYAPTLWSWTSCNLNPFVVSALFSSVTTGCILKKFCGLGLVYPYSPSREIE